MKQGSSAKSQTRPAIAAGANAGRTAIVVLGMHRSGTSAQTRFLNMLGCSLPKTLMGANESNSKGHWESEAIREFNDSLLAEAGSSWSDWRPIHPDWTKSSTYKANKRRARELVGSEFGDAPLFALKDPRICRLAQLWFDVLDEMRIETVVVLPIRNPLEVAASLHKRNDLDPAIGQLLWLRHVLDAEYYSRGRRRVFTRYQDLFENFSGMAARVSSQTQLVWPRSPSAFAADFAGFINPELRHHALETVMLLDDPSQPQWLRHTYAIMETWAQGEHNPSQYAKLDSIRAGFGLAGDNFARVVDALESKRSEIEAISVDRHGLALRLLETQSAMEQIEGEHGATRDEVQEARRRIAELDTRLTATLQHCATLDQNSLNLQAELSTAQGWIDTLGIRLARAKDDLRQSKVRADKLALDNETKDRDQLQLREQLNARRAENDVLTDRLERQRLEISTLMKEIARLQHRGDAALAAGQTSAAEQREREGQIAAAQQRLLDVQSELAIERMSRQLIAQIAAALTTRRKWWVKFLPAALARRIQYNALRHQGVFDADLYLGLYPDVGHAGMDPLNHFVLHGLEEGRRRS